MAFTEAVAKEMLQTLGEQMQEIRALRLQAEEARAATTIPQSPHESHKTEKPKRPQIEANMDDTDWVVFGDSWSRYKRMTGLQEADKICLELRTACSTEVNKLLFEFIGATELNRTNLSEDDLMTHIKQVAVRSVHKEVHRMNFAHLVQAEGETITNFVARLKSQSTLCDFVVKCSCSQKVSFAQEMIAQRLTAGVNNPNHQSKILSEADTLDTLDKKVTRLIGLQTTDDAANQMKPPLLASMSIAAAGRSAFKKAKSSEARHGNTPGQSNRMSLSEARHGNAPGQSNRMPSPGGPANHQQQSQHPKSNGFRNVTGNVYSGRGGRQNTDRNGRQVYPCRGCGKTSHGWGRSMKREHCPAYGNECGACGIPHHFETVCTRSRAGLIQAAHEENGQRNGTNNFYDGQQELSADNFSFALGVQQGFRTNDTSTKPS